MCDDRPTPRSYAKCFSGAGFSDFAGIANPAQAWVLLLLLLWRVGPARHDAGS